MRLIFLLRVIGRLAREMSADRKYSVDYMYKMMGKIDLCILYLLKKKKNLKRP